MAKQGTKAKRTKSGNVSATARKKHGMKSKTAKTGSFPIMDRKSAKAAIKLRGHAKTKKDRMNIINRARKYAPEEAKEAYANDKKTDKI
jgi:hypothetical protein